MLNEPLLNLLFTLFHALANFYFYSFKFWWLLCAGEPLALKKKRKMMPIKLKLVCPILSGVASESTPSERSDCQTVETNSARAGQKKKKVFSRMKPDRRTGNLTDRQWEGYWMNSVTWQKVFRRRVGTKDASVFLPIVQTLYSLQHTVCVGSSGLKAQFLVSGRQPEGQAAVVNPQHNLGQTTWYFSWPPGVSACVYLYIIFIYFHTWSSLCTAHTIWKKKKWKNKKASSIMGRRDVWNLQGKAGPRWQRWGRWGGRGCHTFGLETRGEVRWGETVKPQINKLSLQQLLTIINWWVISLTSVLAVGGHGAVSWDCDSDVLCARLSVCSLVWEPRCCSRGTAVFATCCWLLQTLEKLQLLFPFDPRWRLHHRMVLGEQQRCVGYTFFNFLDGLDLQTLGGQKVG